MNAKTYKITITFLAGLLAGITITDEQVRFEAPVVGWECANPLGGSPYRVVAVEVVK